MAKQREEKNGQVKFEDALKRLEEIVGKLEDGELALDESLRIFEEGIKLSRFCSGKLEEAERKIEILMKNKDGEIEKKPFKAHTDEQTQEGTATKDLF